MSILFIVNKIHVFVDLIDSACGLLAEPLVKTAVPVLLQDSFQSPAVLTVQVFRQSYCLHRIAFPAKALHYGQWRDAFCSVLTDNYPYSADLFFSLADEVEKAPVRESCLHFSSFSAAGLVP